MKAEYIKNFSYSACTTDSARRTEFKNRVHNKFKSAKRAAKASQRDKETNANAISRETLKKNVSYFTFVNPKHHIKKRYLLKYH
jgi:hypothetical protein